MTNTVSASCKTTYALGKVKQASSYSPWLNFKMTQPIWLERVQSVLTQSLTELKEC